jgi:hypothetical protein
MVVLEQLGEVPEKFHVNNGEQLQAPIDLEQDAAGEVFEEV